MFRLLALSLRLITLSSLLFCVRAFAQFEVAPDHFDSPTRQNTVKKKAKAQPATTAHVAIDASDVARAARLRDRLNGDRKSRQARRLQRTRTILRDFAAAANKTKVDKDKAVAVNP